jgi:hypothetical protein
MRLRRQWQRAQDPEDAPPVRRAQDGRLEGRGYSLGGGGARMRAYCFRRRNWLRDVSSQHEQLATIWRAYDQTNRSSGHRANSNLQPRRPDHGPPLQTGVRLGRRCGHECHFRSRSNRRGHEQLQARRQPKIISSGVAKSFPPRYALCNPNRPGTCAHGQGKFSSFLTNFL